MDKIFYYVFTFAYFIFLLLFAITDELELGIWAVLTYLWMKNEEAE